MGCDSWFYSRLLSMKDDRTPVSVLIVEDSTVVRRRIRNMLCELEHIHSVSEAANAPDAMHKVDDARPDFVILDVRLANGTSGLEVLRHIKEISHPCTTIMLTNLAYGEVRQECMSLGADHFFNKATEFERVVEVLSSARTHLMQAPAQ
jgi:DNA-binding NarL/FixJ family response regulator